MIIRPAGNQNSWSARAVIPTILEQLHAGATEIRLGATTPTRDFTYVEDTARGSGTG
jgi:nucleoside-diphosphate-sugar epimerase